MLWLTHMYHLVFPIGPDNVSFLSEAFFHEGDDAQEGFLMSSPQVATDARKNFWGVRPGWKPGTSQLVFDKI